LKTHQQLAGDILQFLKDVPADLAWTRDPEFLYHFESHRLQIITELLADSGFQPGEEFEVLDVGYLHGLIPEFVHRTFPGSYFTVCDRPESPIFKNTGYLDTIRRRPYLNLIPLDVNQVQKLGKKFDLIILGEVIEHLDPTVTAALLKNLRGSIADTGVLLITTPNGSGIYNATQTVMKGAGPQVAPIPDPQMGYAHIHLWTPALLTQTLQHCGWHTEQTRFYHGREGELFARSRRHWGSLKHQVMIKTVEAIAKLIPKYQGFFVMTAVPDKK
jgi:hypothetical protein